MTPRSLILATALGAALSLPAAAGAADLPGWGKDIAYRVQVEGQATYTSSEHVGAGGDDWTGHDVKLKFTYGGDIGDGVVFRNAAPLDTTGDDIAGGAADGTWTDTGSDGAKPPCAVEPGWYPANGLTRMVDDAVLSGTTPLDGSMDLWVRPFEQFDVSFACPDGQTHPGVLLVTSTGDDDRDPDGQLKMGHNPFDIKFNLPRDIIGNGYIEQLDPAKTLEGVNCPNYIAGQTTTCKLEWKARVKLTKLWEKPAPGTQPPGGGAGTPAPAAPLPKPPVVKTPPPTDDDLLAPLVPAKKASLSSDASKAAFSVSCTAGCSGTASLTAAGNGAHRSAAATAKPLARASFTVAPGATKKVTIKLGAKARRAVRRAGGARIVVKATAKGGRKTTRTLTVRVPKARR